LLREHRTRRYLLGAEASPTWGFGGTVGEAAAGSQLQQDGGQREAAVGGGSSCGRKGRCRSGGTTKGVSALGVRPGGVLGGAAASTGRRR
jgi:hypothetical protein